MFVSKEIRQIADLNLDQVLHTAVAILQSTPFHCAETLWTGSLAFYP